MYLPPVTVAQAHAVYALLHVTPAMIRLDRLYTGLYFGSTFLHFVVRFAFLAFGMSAAFRDKSDRLAHRLLSFGIVVNAIELGKKFVLSLKGAGIPIDRIAGYLGSTHAGKTTAHFRSLWQATLFRSAIIYYFLYSLFFFCLWSPLTYYEGYVLPHRYGLSHQAIGAWITDLLKDTSVDTAMGAVSAAFVFWGIALYPRRWATIFAFWSVPIIFAGIFLDPIFGQIDNHFTRLPKTSGLYVSLHDLAVRAGVPNAEILVADKSKQTEETNAYVTGLGSSAQIVLWDTTIKRMPPDEIVAVTGHEIGHYVEHHVIIGGALGAAALFLYLPALKAIAEFLLARFGKRWKVITLADPAALPILLVSLSFLSIITSPITNAVSRVIEHRADSYGLAITRNRLAMARAQVDLANENMSDPDPPKWEVFWLDDHPPGGERIHFALYGQPLSLKR